MVTAEENHHKSDGHDQTRSTDANQHLVIPRHGYAMPHWEKRGIAVRVGHSSLVRGNQVVGLTEFCFCDQQSGRDGGVNSYWCSDWNELLEVFHDKTCGKCPTIVGQRETT